MTSVFIGGSRKVSRLNKEIRSRIDNILQQEFTILIGDANGADKSVQKYLSEQEYPNVLVYCMEGKARNNVGSWVVRNVEARNNKKDFQYYSTKDFRMAEDASYGFMIWDAKSKGSLQNIINLLKKNKKVLVYFSREKEFYTLVNMDDLSELLSKCDPDNIKKFQKQFKGVEFAGVNQPQFHFSS